MLVSRVENVNWLTSQCNPYVPDATKWDQLTKRGLTLLVRFHPVTSLNPDMWPESATSHGPHNCQFLSAA